jgi:glycolate oxidase FAD binding subunit
VRPKTEAELCEAVRAAVDKKTPLEIAGTSTKRALGRPVQAAELLDLSGFSRIELYEPDELVITAGAGTLRSEAEAKLAKKRQCFAFEPPDLSRLLGSAHAGTLGGMLGCNLAGPRRIKAGAARDHILGIEGVNGLGQAFKAGGRVVKNVTGYDVAKLMANSFGTLAALTKLTFKVLPAAKTEETLLLEGLDGDAATRAMTEAMQSSAEVSGAAYLPEDVSEKGRTSTLLRLEGTPVSVTARRDQLASLLSQYGKPHLLAEKASREKWIAIRDVHPLCDGGRDVWRLSVPASDGWNVLTRLRRSIGARGFLDWAGGLIWLDAPPTDDASVQAIRAAVTSGHATLIRAPEPVRAAIDVFQPQPAPLAELSARVKAAFDPHGLFNPGRMYRGR